MSTPLVSIIIPVHNAGRWLAETLESALVQTWPAREIIVVDDHSTDGSRELAQSFASRGVQVLTHPNRGASAARNAGLNAARGELIKFLDADDLLSPEALSLQITALAEKPGCIAFGSWARFYDHPASAVFIPHPGWHDGSGLDWIKETWRDTEPMYQCGLFLIPRELLLQCGGWNEELSLIDDFEFFTRLVLGSAGLVFTPTARLYYRSGLAGSLSGRKSRRAWESAALSTRLATDHLLDKENTPDTRRLAANMLQSLVYQMYPLQRDLVAGLEARIAELGGGDIAPRGGRSFRILQGLIGWKAARHLQIAAGKFPLHQTEA